MNRARKDAENAKEEDAKKKVSHGVHKVHGGRKA
jgi:hypothetical protein